MMVMMMEVWKKIEIACQFVLGLLMRGGSFVARPSEESLEWEGWRRGWRVRCEESGCPFLYRLRRSQRDLNQQSGWYPLFHSCPYRLPLPLHTVLDAGQARRL